MEDVEGVVGEIAFNAQGLGHDRSHHMESATQSIMVLLNEMTTQVRQTPQAETLYTHVTLIGTAWLKQGHLVNFTIYPAAQSGKRNCATALGKGSPV